MTEVRIGWIDSTDFRVSDSLCIRGSDLDSWKTVIGGQWPSSCPAAGPVDRGRAGSMPSASHTTLRSGRISKRRASRMPCS